MMDLLKPAISAMSQTTRNAAVLILVMMDLLKPAESPYQIESDGVLILVMMDLLKPVQTSEPVGDGTNGLNPCYDGSSKASNCYIFSGRGLIMS